MPTSSKRKPAREHSGKLRIGDDWNAINIIALSQSNPLKAVAEFVENRCRSICIPPPPPAYNESPSAIVRGASYCELVEIVD
jgi:hypothetical protein